MEQTDDRLERIVRFSHHQGMRQVMIVTIRQSHRTIDQLDETDRKMLELLTRGYTDRKISNEVCLSLQTVRNRISRLLKKLKLSNRTQLALHASRLNLGSSLQSSLDYSK
ncbi:MAG: DNA-binding response regulator [Actinobacteria bacterium]|nr:DNA-binding response regulator [Actinomycetota bacterium]